MEYASGMAKRKKDGAHNTQQSGTPALQVLHEADATFELIEYEHSTVMEHGYALDSAAILGLDPNCVFKTLLVSDGTHHGVGLVPASKILNLKSMAKALGLKSVAMMEPAKAERVTGYVTGGISPLGQKQKLPTIVDVGALDFERICISGGKRSLSVLISPKELATIIGASFAKIAHVR